MDITSLLQSHQFPQAIIDSITQKGKGISTLHPPQALAIEQGVLDGKNVVMAVPTASGKTLIAELCMLKAILQKGGRALYIAPLKALASEKFTEFTQKYAAHGISIGIATGDLDSPSAYLNRYQILIATAEKIDSLLRQKASWLIHGLSVIVLDEVHVIDDDHRGPTLEILVTRLRQMKPDAQILALSATIANARELASWLDANLAFSQWRPVPLREGVFYNNQIHFNNDSVKLIDQDHPEDINNLTLDTLKGGGQALVFVNSRRSAQAVARELCPTISPTLTAEEREHLLTLAKEIAQDSAATKVCKKLSDCIKNGTAFHHAGLKPKQRQSVEDYFKRNLIKVICSTPTLAAGVNLPARRSIIRDTKRFANGLGSVFIPVSEYKQCAGRAGRPQFDSYGEAVIMAKSLSEQQTLYDKFILSSPEPVTSKLGSPTALRIHVLSSVAAGYVHDVNSMFDFLHRTFLSHQHGSSNLLALVAQIFDFLHQNGFIDKSGFRFFTTPFGQYTSRLYIDPSTALTLRTALNKIQKGHPLSTYGLLHMLACCPDSDLLNVSKSDYEEIESLGSRLEDELILSPHDLTHLHDAYTFYATLKTMWLLSRWIDEDTEDEMCDQFNVGPGDIYRHVESAQWLLYAAGTFAQLFHHKKMTFMLESLRQRMRYGIKEELLELASLRGVGRIRARALFAHGLQSYSDLKKLSAQDIGRIKTIGPSLAKEIIKQINEPLLPKRSALITNHHNDAEPLAEEELPQEWTD